jgi:exonuclease SbcC
MRPIQLTIKNFLSYGNEAQIINLDINSIISFTGNNGHGKSALLEAITWALWGQARRGQGVSKSDDMIMHVGSTSMFVTLEIKVKNDYYKIHRTCEKKHNRIFTGLELYSCNKEEETNLSSAHQKDTQSLIEKIIGISYDMFINTVYLKQGNSNEFSKKTAKERKDILCSILKIDQIEEIRQKILDDIKIIIQDRAVLLKLEERLLDDKKEQQLLVYQNDFDILKTEIKNITEILHLLQEDYEIAKNTNIEGHNTYIEKNNIIEGCQKNIQYLYTLYTIDNIPYQQYKKASIELEKINSYNQSQIPITEIRKRLVEIENTQKKIRQEYDETLKKNQVLLQGELEICNQNIVSFLENADDCKVFQLKQELYYIEKILTQYSNNEDSCFFCDTPIANKVTQITTEINKLQEKKTEIEKKIIQFTLEKNSTLEQFELIKKNKINSYKSIEETLTNQFKIKRDKLETIKKEYLEKEIEYNAVSIYSEKKVFLESEIAAFLTKEIPIKLKKTIQAIYENKNTIQELHFIIKNEKLILDNQQIELQNKKNILEKKNKELSELEKKLYEIQNYISLLTEQIKQDKNELITLQEKIRQIESNLKIKSNLAHILSKNNLQAALIEEAIPIIEEEANIILQKLTNGSSKIYIESIKDLKSGSIKETLDIKIADHIGIRYYEFFSGGESFRIDLALRIALVKLLAQKSGHYIKTFIIDEGFGSQDSQSLEIMIDTLYMLQNEFDLIIIISHLNDMKEQFPIQFHIEKTIRGSIIKQL